MIFVNKGITKYVAKAVALSVGAIVVVETASVVAKAVKLRKEVIKQVSSENPVNLELVKEAKSPRQFMNTIKEAAKIRVAEIKKDPREIFIGVYGLFAMWTGHYFGAAQGAIQGYNYAAQGPDKIINIFRKLAPDEFKAMVKKCKEIGGENTEYPLTEMYIQKIFGPTYYRSTSWNPHYVKFEEGEV